MKADFNAIHVDFESSQFQPIVATAYELTNGGSELYWNNSGQHRNTFYEVVAFVDGYPGPKLTMLSTETSGDRFCPVGCYEVERFRCEMRL